MKIRYTLTALLATAASASAANILSPSDFIIAIGDVESASNYPGGEPPAALLDQNSGTKYLNFGKENSGFIVTPSGGSSVVQSAEFVSANDAAERDPLTYSLWGTNDTIASIDGGLGNGESWTPIVAGASTGLSTNRLTSGGFDNFTNAASYLSYRVSFDTLRDSGLADSIQLADMNHFGGASGTGGNVLVSGSSVIAFDFDTVATSGFPGAESPTQAIDGDISTKYLNFGGDNTGFIVTPGSGSSVVDGFTITTGNDAPGRDPVGYSLFGTTDAITSAENSDGSAENWILIQSGTLTPPSGRGEEYGDVIAGNSSAYTSYRFDVDSNGGDGLMQFAEFQLHCIPEPSTGVLALLGLMPLLRRKR